MTIQINNIKYNLKDTETNPNNDIKPHDFYLPTSLSVPQDSIDKLFGEDFNMERDLNELVTCHTGFEPSSFDHSIC